MPYMPDIWHFDQSIKRAGIFKPVILLKRSVWHVDVIILCIFTSKSWMQEERNISDAKWLPDIENKFEKRNKKCIVENEIKNFNFNENLTVTHNDSFYVIPVKCVTAYICFNEEICATVCWQPF